MEAGRGAEEKRRKTGQAGMEMRTAAEEMQLGQHLPAIPGSSTESKIDITGSQETSRGS